MRNILNGPVLGDDYFTRETEERKIWRGIRHGKNIAICGPVKSGKTSLVHNLKRSVSDKTDIKILDVLELIDDKGSVSRLIQFINDEAFCDDYGPIFAYNIVVLDNLDFALMDLDESQCRLLLTELERHAKEQTRKVHFVFVFSAPLSFVIRHWPIQFIVDTCLEIEITELNIDATIIMLGLLSHDVDFVIDEPLDLQETELAKRSHSIYQIKLLFDRLTLLVIEQDKKSLRARDVAREYEILSKTFSLWADVFNSIKKRYSTADLFFVSALLDDLLEFGFIGQQHFNQLYMNNKQVDKSIIYWLVFQRFLEEKNGGYVFYSELNEQWWQQHKLAVVSEGKRNLANFKSVRVRQLTIKNVRCFKLIDIDFNEHNQSTLLLAANARGKTTILQLIALALSGVKYVPFEYCWKQVIRYGEQEASFSIAIEFDNKPIELAFLIDEQNNLCFQGEEAELRAICDNLLVLAYGANRHIKLEDPKPNKAMEPIATLFGENGYLKHIKSSSNYQYVSEHFEPIKGLINTVLHKADLGDKVSLCDFDTESLYFDAPSGEHLPIEALSEGFKSTFVWLFDMIIRLVEKGVDIESTKDVNGVVLLDEVDLHLHPSWQRTILPSLIDVFPQIQFFVTTHSPFVAQSIEVDHVLSLEWKDNAMTCEVKSMTDELSYSAVAREIFGISSPFSAVVEKRLKRFDELKKQIIAKQDYDKAEFKQLVEEIANGGVELNGMMRREIMTLERNIGEELDLWIS